MLIETLLEHPSHILPLEGTLRTRIRSLDDLGDQSGGDVFEKFPVTLSALPESFRSSFH